MFEMNRYFTSFLAEMQTYLSELRHQIEYLHLRVATNEQVLLLRRLGHTIAGLTKTVDLPDFAGLGEAVDEAAARFLITNMPLTATLAPPLTNCADYITRRLATMATARNFVAPTFRDMRDADVIAAALVAIAPAPPAGMAITGIHPPYAAQPDDGADAADALSPEWYAASMAFLRSQLRPPSLTASSAPTVSSVVEMPQNDPEVLGDFIIEMNDDLVNINQILLAMPSTTTTPADLLSLGETAHKLKGAAAMLGMTMTATIGEMFESVVKALRIKRIAVSPEIVHWLLENVQALEVLHTHIKATGHEGDIQARYSTLHAFYTQIFTVSQHTPTRPRPTVPDAEQPAAPPSFDTMKPVDAERRQVRIDMHRIDQIMNTLNSFLICRIAIRRMHAQAVTNEEEMPGVIARLIALSDRLRAERVATLHNPTTGEGARPAVQPSISTRLAERRPTAEDGMDIDGSSGVLDLGGYGEFDQLMTMVGETILDLRTLHLSLQTALNQIGRQSEHLDFFTESIQRDLLDLRLVPFTAMAGRLDIVARATAMLLNKEVDFTIVGAEHEIDRDISTTIVEPLSQLVRNAIVHGIETPTERFAAGKNEPPRVVMSVTTTGDEIAIAISDNGRGINPHQLAADLLAREDPRMTAARARAITMDEAYALILAPDVSTAAAPSSLAGSGIGLPYVQAMIASVHGSLHIHSETGVGTTFYISLPVNLSTARALTVFAGKNGYAIPVGDIHRIMEVTPAMIHTTPRGAVAMIDHDDASVTAMRVLTLPQLLGHPEILTTGNRAIVVAVDAEEFVIIVDQIGEERNMVVRKVPQYLHQRHVRGASITATGEVLLILSLPALISKVMAQGHLSEPTPLQTPPTEEAEQGDYILIVDDSPSIRHGLEQGLTQAGYAVKVARDGVEAIEQMNRCRPRLIILDIEMPHLNGYELLEVIRANVPFHDLRVIMLTSQAGSRHRAKARDLGATGFLAKPATTDELIAAVERALDHNAQTAYN